MYKLFIIFIFCNVNLGILPNGYVYGLGYHRVTIYTLPSYKNKCLASLNNSIFDYYNLLKGRFLFNKQLDNIKVYIAVDDDDNPIVSYYPLNKGVKDNVKPVKVDKIKGLPSDVNLLLCEFYKLFSDDEGCAKRCTNESRHNINTFKNGIPNVLLHFMDPNACMAHVEELRRQNQNAKLKCLTLKDFFKDNANVTNILLPLQESLAFVTKNNKSFQGTPIFTTYPPIIKTTKGGKITEFDPRYDEFMVFLTLMMHMIYTNEHGGVV